MSFTRRGLLTAGAASAVLVACKGGELAAKDDKQPPDDTGPDRPDPVAWDPEDISADDLVFPLAVQAGGMERTRALLATFVDGPDQVRVRVWQPGEDAGTVLLYVDEDVSPSEGYLKVEVTELFAGEWFEYGFFETRGDKLTGRSILGRFRTALPADSTDPVTFAVTACNGSSNDPWPALIETAKHDYDALIHLGDMAYNDSAETLQEYRDNWKWYLGGQGFKEAFARAGLYATWDDHEFDNDWNPETFDPARLEAALTSYFELIAVDEGPDPYQLWRSYMWGKTVEILVLDCRTERKPSTRRDAGATYLSKRQMGWLQDRLKNSKAHFKLVMNSVPITNMPNVWDVYAVDRWEGYQAQRTELLDFIKDEDIDNVWFLGGDFHVCFVGRVEPGGGGVLDRTLEIAVTGGNTNFLGDTLPNQQFVYGVGDARALLVTLDPSDNSVSVTYLKDDGSVDFEQTFQQA